MSVVDGLHGVIGLTVVKIVALVFVFAVVCVLKQQMMVVQNHAHYYRVVHYKLKHAAIQNVNV